MGRTRRLSTRSICDKTAIVSTTTRGSRLPDPRGTSKWVKPGVVFSAVGANGKSEAMVGWPSKTAKLPSMLFGGAIK